MGQGKYQVLRSKAGRKGLRVSPTVDIEELRKGLRVLQDRGRAGYLAGLAELMEKAAGQVERFPGFVKWQDPDHVAEALRVAGWLYDEQEAMRAVLDGAA